ncbi:MAG: hypothetical protein ACYT04_25520 [Nostoc sp.]
MNLFVVLKRKSKTIDLTIPHQRLPFRCGGSIFAQVYNGIVKNFQGVLHEQKT